MCDTLWKKQEDYSIFLKNSDRAVNEPNLCIYFPRGAARGHVKCTYITIPDLDEHYATLLVKPSWIWGAEIGINEHGVSIGNEAVFTRSKNKKEKRLIGMDFLRLALERSQTAKQAVDVIVSLLQQHGQGGNCGFDSAFYYDNSYLIADKDEACVLETAGKDYVIKAANGCANISNRLSAKDEFSKRNTEPIFTYFSGSQQRMNSAKHGIQKAVGLGLHQYFDVLRQHTVSQKQALSKGSVTSVCMHAGLLGDHTTGSMVTIVKDRRISVWTTGSSSPCLSIFKPTYFIPDTDFLAPPYFTNEQKSLAYWIRREKLNRLIYSGAVDLNEWSAKATKLQNSFIEKEQLLISDNLSAERLIAFSKECANEEESLINEYQTIIDDFNHTHLSRYWGKKSQRLGRNVFERELCKRKN